MRRFVLPVAASFVFTFVAAALHAETKITITKTHLCCPQCIQAVDKTLKGMEGVTHKASQEAKSIEITASSDEAAQKAVDALATAGFYGAIDSETVKYKLAEAPKGEVERLEVIGVHNCCGACTQAIKKALGTVEGVTANTAKPKADSFVIEGKFSAEKALKALLDAGFCAQAKKQ
jgi:copper chaperone CopZ